MNLVFAHDHKFALIDGEYYSNGSFGLPVLKRYTNVFSDLNIISRQYTLDDSREKINFTISSDNNINFSKVPNLNSLNYFRNIKHAKKIIDEHVYKADYLIARLPSTIGSLAIKSAIKFNKPYLIEVVGCPWDTLLSHSLKGKVLAPFYYRTMKQDVYNANYVIYVTNLFLQNRYPTLGKSINISNVSLANFNNEIITKRQDKINKNINSDKIIIGTTAAVDVKYKGQEYVIKALKRLEDMGYTNFEYQLVGNGDNSYLNRIVKKYRLDGKIKFLGSLSHNEVFKWLDNIDIYAQPSKTEGLPRAVIEAMSRGLPAIGSDAGGIPELLEEDFIFSSNMNVKEIANIILKFDKNTLLKQSIRNFEESKKYSSYELEKRREEFLREFKSNKKESDYF